MTSVQSDARVINPRWNGQLALFDLDEGGMLTPCSISRDALEDLSPKRHFRPADLQQHFSACRHRIASIATAKLGRRSEGIYGVLQIWASDVDELPTLEPDQATMPA